MGCTCNDGLIHTRDSKGYERAYTCECADGERLRVALYAPTDRKKERPIYIPRYRAKVTMPDHRRDVRAAQTGENQND